MHLIQISTSRGQRRTRTITGRLGGKRVTQVGLTIHGVDPERNLLLVKGAVPGPKNGLVEVREERAHGRA